MGAIRRLPDNRLQAPPREEFVACDACSGSAFYVLQQAGVPRVAVAAAVRIACVACGQEYTRSQR